MPSRKRKSQDPIGIGMTAKQLKRKKPINTDFLVDIEPLTENQEKFFKAYSKGQSIFSYGCAGTGKTFIALYNALKDVLNEYTPYKKIYIVRSLVDPPVRLVSSLETMKISLLCIRFHTKTWLNTCLRCQLMQILICYGGI